LAEINAEERMKRALELVDKIDLPSLVKVFSSLLRAYGGFAKAIGTLQRDQKDSYEALQYLGEMAPDFLGRLIEKAPPEIIGTLMKIFVRMATLTTKLNQLMDLPPEEKIRLGESLLEFANDFEKLLELKKEKKE